MTAVVVEVDAHEGPVYVPDEHALYFTSVPAPDVAIKRLSLASGEVSVLRADANAANGMALHPDGRLLVCEQGTRSSPARISLVDRATGAAETVVDGWGGLPLNSPNDVVVKRDGTVWFTDPSYGFLQGFRPAPALGDFVYRHDPRTGETTVVAEGFDKPNGLAFSPDERVLYVGDSGREHAPRSRPSTSSTGTRSPRAGSLPSSIRATPTASRSTPPGSSTRPGRPACRSSTPTAMASARSPCPAP